MNESFDTKKTFVSYRSSSSIQNLKIIDPFFFPKKKTKKKNVPQCITIRTCIHLGFRIEWFFFLLFFFFLGGKKELKNIIIIIIDIYIYHRRRMR